MLMNVFVILVSLFEFEDQIFDVDVSGNKLRVDVFFFGVIKNFKLNKVKFDIIMIMNLIYLVKSRFEFFLFNRVVEVSWDLIRLQ